MIDYRYRVFLAVASKMSFSKAAQELFVSQPSVSKQIKLLEEEAGLALFERRGNEIAMTPMGKKLFAHLQKAKLIQRDILADFASLKKSIEIKGELKIGASTTVSLYVIPKVLAAFQKEFPLVDLLLVNRNSENVLKALSNYEVDLACVESAHGTASVHNFPFMDDEIIAVCSNKSPYRAKEMTLDDLVKRPLALREQGSGTLDVLTKSLTRNNIKMGKLNIVARLGGTEALKNYIREAEAIGFLSRLAVRKEIEAGDLIEVKIPQLEVKREFRFVMRKGEETIGVVKHFIRIAHLAYN